MKTRSLTTIAVLATVLLAGANDAAAATLHVSQTSPNPTPPYASWDTAAHAIQEAVDVSNDGDTVLVAAGEYRLTNPVSITKAIVLQSHTGPAKTSLDGRGFTRCLWMSNSIAIVDGFTITRGYESDGSGLAGGVVMFGGVLTDCVVNSVFPAGRLVYCSSGGLVTDCQIGPYRATSAKGAGVYLTDSELRNSTISGITGSGFAAGLEGAGVYAVSSTISDCMITGNWVQRAGGGAYLDRSEMDRCIVTGNVAGFHFGPAGLGGGVFATNSVIRNSLIAGNRVHPGSGDSGDGTVPGFGGGVHLLGGSLVNCTVIENHGSGTGGGIYTESGVVYNSIVYFNSAWSDTNWHNGGGGSFGYVCTTPDPGGVGNVVEDPQFVDPTNGDYRLQQTSPCVDAGINEEWMVGAYDLDGNPRIINGTVDLGAWEAPLMDTDGDGVLDRRDFCPNTPAGSVVNADGCSIAQLCPCEGPWRNHQEYVTCVREHAWEFYRAGLISAYQRQELIRAAAQSDCGK